MFGKVTTLFRLLVDSRKEGVKIEAELLRAAEIQPGASWPPDHWPAGYELMSEEQALALLAELLAEGEGLADPGKAGSQS